MMPYACLSTGKDVGMIEVVRQAKTVYGIQRQGGKLAAIQVDSTQLHKWIKEKNKGTKYFAIILLSLLNVMLMKHIFNQIRAGN